MKKLTLLIVSALFIQSTISAQFGEPCLPEGITFTTQADIDNFQTNYPDCTEIQGNVRISGDDIKNLNGLNVLTSMGGGLWIYGTVLTSLTGLGNLTSLEGNLSIGYDYYGNFHGNPSLTSLTGLENLTSIVGSLNITSNDTLTSLTGLDNVTSIGENLYIHRNNALTTLTGLENLTFINGYLRIGNTYSLGNPSLTNLDGLANLTSIGEYCQISQNPFLRSLTGLANLTSIGEYLRINSNDSLTSLTGLENIDTGSFNSLFIYDNISLSICEAPWLCDYLSDPNGVVTIHSNAPGCNNPPEIANNCGFTLPCFPYGNYYFFTQAEIDSFSANYGNCIVLEGDVFIQGDDITNLNGLNDVTAIGGHLNLSNSPYLTNVSGLANVASIGGNLWIDDNANLIDLTGLDKLTYVGGDLFIANNYSLFSLAGLHNLTSIGGSLRFNNNHDLRNLAELHKLTSIGGYLKIEHCDALTNLSGLDNLSSIGGMISIRYNAAIESLTGLDNVAASSINHLGIYGNYLLSSCEVQSICEFLASPDASTEIYSNAWGCGSRGGIEWACLTVSVDEVHLSDMILISPNPSSTQITIELPNTPQKNAMLSIQNMNGQQMLTSKMISQKTVVDVSGLPNGFYFVKVADDSTMMVGKLVKK